MTKAKAVGVGDGGATAKEVFEGLPHDLSKLVGEFVPDYRTRILRDFGGEKALEQWKKELDMQDLKTLFAFLDSNKWVLKKKWPSHRWRSSGRFKDIWADFPNWFANHFELYDDDITDDEVWCKKFAAEAEGDALTEEELAEVLAVKAEVQDYYLSCTDPEQYIGNACRCVGLPEAGILMSSAYSKAMARASKEGVTDYETVEDWMMKMCPPVVAGCGFFDTASREVYVESMQDEWKVGEEEEERKREEAATKRKSNVKKKTPKKKRRRKRR